MAADPPVLDIQMTQTKLHQPREEWQVPPLELPLGIGSRLASVSGTTPVSSNCAIVLVLSAPIRPVQLSPESRTMVLWMVPW